MRTGFLVLAWLLGRGCVIWLLLGPESWVNGDVGYFADSLSAGGWTASLREYPLPAVAALAVPWVLAGATGLGYGTVLGAVAVLTDAAFTVALWLLAPARRDLAVLVWVLAVPLLGATAYARFDLLPGVLAGLALLLLARHPRTALALTAGAAAVKLWPAVLVPGFLAGVRRRAAALYAAAAVGLALAAATVAVAGVGRLLSPLTYQADRGLQIESVAATPAVLLWWADPGRWPISYAPSRAYEVSGPGVSALLTASAAATVLLAVALVLAWAAAWRCRHRAGADTVVWVSLAAVTGLVVTGKVLSPQYLLWLLPLAAASVAVSPRGRAVPAWAAVLLLAAGCTHLVFPTFYAGLTLRSGHVALAVLLLVARNVLLVALTGVAWWRLAASLRDARPQRGRPLARQAPGPEGGVPRSRR